MKKNIDNFEDVLLFDRNAITVEAEQLFSGKKSGHLSYLAYGTPLYNGDDVNGATYWSDLCKSKDYYVIREDENLLLNTVLAEMNEYAGNWHEFVDLGPGDTYSVRAKSIPLINTVKTKSYTAIDMVEYFANEAAQYVSDYSGRTTHAEICNFFQDPIKSRKRPALLYLGGGTIANLPVDLIITNPVLFLSHVFSSFRRSVCSGSAILLGFDANQDENVLNNAYQQQATKNKVEDVARRIARDTHFDFDPSSFEYQTLWMPNEHRYAHFLVAQEKITIKSPNGDFHLNKKHALHVINSFKFPPEMMSKAAENAGWKTKKIWTETGRVHYMLFEAV